jgi:phosphoglucosamine mutase
LQVLAVVQKEGRPVSEICRRFEPLPQILKNVKTTGGQPLKDEGVSAAIEKIRASLGKGGRLVIRPSGTEPVIRVMAEGDDRDLVARVVDDVCAVIAKAA